MTEDERYLDLLAIFHYIVGSITALFACFPLIHVTVGVMMILGKFKGHNPPPQFIGWFFVLIGGCLILCGWALAIAVVVAGRKLKKRTSRTYCMVVSAPGVHGDALWDYSRSVYVGFADERFGGEIVRSQRADDNIQRIYRWIINTVQIAPLGVFYRTGSFWSPSAPKSASASSAPGRFLHLHIFDP